MRIVSYFWSYIFKKRQINYFKHEKSNHFRFFQKIISNRNYLKQFKSSKSVIQKIVTESSLNTKY